MKNNKKKGTRTLADWRVLYYSFRGGKFVTDIMLFIGFLVIVGYKFYHWLFISQSYAQDDETLWLLIPLAAILIIEFILIGIEVKLRDEYKRALKVAKARRKNREMTIQDMMDIHENNMVEEIIRSESQKLTDETDKTIN